MPVQLKDAKGVKYFSILNGVKIEITHSIAHVNIHLSISVTGMSKCLSDCVF